MLKRKVLSNPSTSKLKSSSLVQLELVKNSMSIKAKFFSPNHFIT